jgi:hypothetical protein
MNIYVCWLIDLGLQFDLSYTEAIAVSRFSYTSQSCFSTHHVLQVDLKLFSTMVFPEIYRGIMTMSIIVKCANALRWHDVSDFSNSNQV